MQAFENIAGDLGLFLAALDVLELRDWCVLEASSQWIHAAVQRSYSRLAISKANHYSRCDVTNSAKFCAIAGVTGLWAWVRQYDLDLTTLRDPSRGNPILHVALEICAEKCLDTSRRLVAWLLTRPEASVLAGMRNKSGKTPLHVAAKHGLAFAVHRLTQLASVEVDVLDNYDATPLLEAVREEQVSVINLLVAAGADVNVFVANLHGHGETPLTLAVRFKNVPIVRSLLAAPGINLHQKTMTDCPFGSEAIDFAPSQGVLRDMLVEAIETGPPQPNVSVDSTQSQGFVDSSPSSGALEQDAICPNSCQYYDYKTDGTSSFVVDKPSGMQIKTGMLESCGPCVGPLLSSIVSNICRFS